ncbi:glycosyltransferase [Ferrovibrio terrae]
MVEPAALPACTLVIRTTGRRAQTLSQAIRSALRQDIPRMQIVVVEDGGRAAESLVKGLAGEAAQNLVYLSIPAAGRSQAANAGLAAATGDFIGFLDDDDMLLPSHCEVLARALMAAPDAPAAFAGWYEVGRDADFPDVPSTGAQDWRLGSRRPFSRPGLLLANLFPIQAVLFRRAAWLQAGGFSPDLEALEDWDFWLRLSQIGLFASVDATTSVCRVAKDAEEAVRRTTDHASARQAILARYADAEFTIQGSEVQVLHADLANRLEEFFTAGALVGALWRVVLRNFRR